MEWDKRQLLWEVTSPHSAQKDVLCQVVTVEEWVILHSSHFISDSLITEKRYPLLFGCQKKTDYLRMGDKTEIFQTPYQCQIAFELNQARDLLYFA